MVFSVFLSEVEMVEIPSTGTAIGIGAGDEATLSGEWVLFVPNQLRATLLHQLLVSLRVQLLIAAQHLHATTQPSF